MKDDEKTARELLDREYGKDHPAARHGFTLTFRTTTHEHQVRELTAAFAAVRADATAKEQGACIATLDRFVVEMGPGLEDDGEREAFRGVFDALKLVMRARKP